MHKKLVFLKQDCVVYVDINTYNKMTSNFSKLVVKYRLHSITNIIFVNMLVLRTGLEVHKNHARNIVSLHLTTMITDEISSVI